MNTEVLEDLGLTTIEVKVFLSLLSLGECKAGKIMEATRLQSSSVYHAIHGLVKRGLVSYIKKSEVKYYRASDPKDILNYIDLKKKEYLTLLPELEAKQKKEALEGVEYYTSFKGIKSMMSKMIEHSKKGDTMRVFSIEDPELYEKAGERVFNFMKHLMIEKKIEPRGIFSEKVRRAPDSTSRMQKRYVIFPLPPSTTILGDMVAIVSWEVEPKGTLIHSKDIAHQYSLFFEHLWSIGKK